MQPRVLAILSAVDSLGIDFLVLERLAGSIFMV